MTDQGAEQAPTVAQLLESDLERKGMTQQQLAEQLTKITHRPISQQAISAWKQRNYIPPKQRGPVVMVLGEDSHVAHYLDSPDHVRDFQQILRREVARGRATPFVGIAQPSLVAYTATPRKADIAAATIELQYVAEHLPAPYRPHWHNGEAERNHLDYVSPQLAANVRIAASAIQHRSAFAEALLALLLLQRATAATHPGRTYLLVILTPEPTIEQRRTFDTLAADCYTLGIRVDFVRSAKEAADAIVSRELPVATLTGADKTG